MAAPSPEQSLIRLEPVQLGDANLDGAVDGADFLLWNDNKFSPSGAWGQGDFNADGTTDGADFLLWNEFKFQSADDVVVVPEPFVGRGALLILYLFMRRLRRK